MFKNLFFVLAFIISVLLSKDVQAIGYPALDTTSHWTVGSFGYSPGEGISLRNMNKKIWTSPGVSEERTVFYYLSVIGVKKGGVEYPLPSPQLAVGPTPNGNTSIIYVALFVISSGVTFNVTFQFDDNGVFEFAGVFNGQNYNSNDNWTIITKVDYDIGGSAINTVDFLWNKNSEGVSISPPQYPANESTDGKLVYNLATGSNSDYWSSSYHEITMVYPTLKRSSGPSVENLGFAKIKNSNFPEFGMVLWGDSITKIDATFKSYSGEINLNPTANAGITLQGTYEIGNYPRAASVGKDQMMFLKLESSVLNSNSTISRFGGKLYQRPYDFRPLYVRVYQHPTMDMGGWRFDPNMTIRTVGGVNRTFKKALEELVGTDNLIIQRSGDPGIPYLPYTGYASAGQSITESKLHTLMMNTRNYSNLNNVREWQIDLFITNWTLQGEPSVYSTMFDQGAINTNHVSREGGAFFWKSLTSKGADFQRKQSLLSSLQIIGSALNMHPGWSNCPFTGYCWNDASSCGGKKCGSGCPSGVSGCHFSAYNCEKECKDGTITSLTDFNKNTIQFNSSTAPGSNFSEYDWYDFAPEAWVKPGRFGTQNISTSQMPQF